MQTLAGACRNVLYMTTIGLHLGVHAPTRKAIGRAPCTDAINIPKHDRHIYMYTDAKQDTMQDLLPRAKCAKSDIVYLILHTFYM